MGLTPLCDTIQTFYVSNAENIQELPDVCYGSSNYVTVWTDLRNGVDRLIRAARITPQWAVLDTGIVVAQNSSYQITPVVAFDGSRSLVVWQNLAAPMGIYCRFLDSNGQPDDSVITVSSAINSSNPRVVFGGSQYLVVWQEYTVTSQIAGRFVSPSGVLVGDEISITSGTANHVSPGVCFDGDKYLVVWSQNQIWGQFLSSAGSPIGMAFPVSVVANDQADPDVFFGEGNFLAIWSEFRTDYDIYGNLDAQVGVSGSNNGVSMAGHVHPDRTIFTDVVKLVGMYQGSVTVFNVLGEKVDILRRGVWDARSHPPGIYFLSCENGYAHTVIKVRQ